MAKKKKKKNEEKEEKDEKDGQEENLDDIAKNTVDDIFNFASE